MPNAVAASAAAREAEPSRARRDRFAFFGNHRAAQGRPRPPRRRRPAAGARRRPAIYAARRPRHARTRPSAPNSTTRLRAAAPLAQHLGPYDRAEVVGLMRQADWVVVPSIWWENAPLVIHEARAAGRPVICSGHRRHGRAASKHGVDGLHVPPGDPAALAETLRVRGRGRGVWARLGGDGRARQTTPPSSTPISASTATSSRRVAA